MTSEENLKSKKTWRPKHGGQAKERQAKVLAQLGLGKTVEAATAAVGLQASTHFKWMDVDPEYRREVDAIRGRRKTRPLNDEQVRIVADEIVNRLGEEDLDAVDRLLRKHAFDPEDAGALIVYLANDVFRYRFLELIESLAEERVGELREAEATAQA